MFLWFLGASAPECLRMPLGANLELRTGPMQPAECLPSEPEEECSFPPEFIAKDPTLNQHGDNSIKYWKIIHSKEGVTDEKAHEMFSDGESLMGLRRI